MTKSGWSGNGVITIPRRPVTLTNEGIGVGYPFRISVARLQFKMLLAVETEYLGVVDGVSFFEHNHLPDMVEQVYTEFCGGVSYVLLHVLLSRNRTL